MTGRITESLDVRTFLNIRGPEGDVGIVADIDTGFSEFLIVPAPLLAVVGAQAESAVEATLGDGTVVEFETCWVEVEWFGEWRIISAYVGGGDALIGMKLLEGYALHVRVVPGGEVRVEPI